MIVGCRAELLKAVEIPHLQFLDQALTMTSCSFVGAKMQVKVSIGSCARWVCSCGVWRPSC